MATIDIRRFGFALGTTFAFLYLGCVLIMAVLSREAAIFFFNSLMHGVDMTSILRTNMPLYEMMIGIVEIFVLGWLIGATVASLYNLAVKGK